MKTGRLNAEIPFLGLGPAMKLGHCTFITYMMATTNLSVSDQSEPIISSFD